VPEGAAVGEGADAEGVGEPRGVSVGAPVALAHAVAAALSVPAGVELSDEVAQGERVGERVPGAEDVKEGVAEALRVPGADAVAPEREADTVALRVMEGEGDAEALRVTENEPEGERVPPSLRLAEGDVEPERLPMALSLLLRLASTVTETLWLWEPLPESDALPVGDDEKERNEEADEEPDG
jgi:hypothetical protein